MADVKKEKNPEAIRLIRDLHTTRKGQFVKGAILGDDDLDGGKTVAYYIKHNFGEEATQAQLEAWRKKHAEDVAKAAEAKARANPVLGGPMARVMHKMANLEARLEKLEGSKK